MDTNGASGLAGPFQPALPVPLAFKASADTSTAVCREPEIVGTLWHGGVMDTDQAEGADIATAAVPAAAAPAVTRLGASEVNGWIAALVAIDRDVDDASRRDQIRALEDLKSAAAAAQALISVDFDASQRRLQAEAGTPAAKLGLGIGKQIALARRESPKRGCQHLGLAKILTTEMPHTFAALTAGLLTEWRATILVRETACLRLEDRHAVDDELAADTGILEGVGDEALGALARGIAYRLDPHAALARASKAEGDRYVSLRPAPDTMTYLTALLPVKTGVAVFAALSRAADTLTAGGDPRLHHQIMADLLTQRITGNPAGPTRIEIQLVMTDRTLLQGDSEPAYLPGYGPVPAQQARNLARDSGKANRGNRNDERTETWLRRLYTSPGAGELIAMDAKSRLLPRALKRVIKTRDNTCRFPYCNAPIRHADHVVPWRISHDTSEANAQGLCVACNQAKEAPGWSAQPRPGPRHTVEITTPTGHTYTSTAPPLPGSTLGGGELTGS